MIVNMFRRKSWLMVLAHRCCGAVFCQQDGWITTAAEQIPRPNFHPITRKNQNLRMLGTPVLARTFPIPALRLGWGPE